MTGAVEPAWVLWSRGLRGPEIAVLRYRGNPPTLSDLEKAHMLAAPVRIDPDDALLPLRAIERLYPPPKIEAAP